MDRIRVSTTTHICTAELHKFELFDQCLLSVDGEGGIMEEALGELTLRIGRYCSVIYLEEVVLIHDVAEDLPNTLN